MIFSSLSSSQKWKNLLNFLLKEDEKLSHCQGVTMKMMMSFSSSNNSEENETKERNFLVTHFDCQCLADVIGDVIGFGESLRRYFFHFTILLHIRILNFYFPTSSHVVPVVPKELSSSILAHVRRIETRLTDPFLLLTSSLRPHPPIEPHPARQHDEWMKKCQKMYERTVGEIRICAQEIMKTETKSTVLKDEEKSENENECFSEIQFQLLSLYYSKIGALFCNRNHILDFIWSLQNFIFDCVDGASSSFLVWISKMYSFFLFYLFSFLYNVFTIYVRYILYILYGMIDE